MGPRSGAVVQTDAKAYTFRFGLKGRAARRVRAVRLLLDGKPRARRMRPRRSFRLRFANPELQHLAPGKHRLVANVRLRKPVRLRAGQRKRRSLKLAVGFVVRQCPAPTMSVRHLTTRPATRTGLSLRATSGGPALARVGFRVARALRPVRWERSRSWRRKAVGVLTLRQGKKTTFRARLRAPRRMRRRLVFRLANGVVVTWTRRKVAVSGLPEGVSGVWLRLHGTRKLRPYINPARTATLKHSARLVARDQSAATVSRKLRIGGRALRPR